MPPAPPKPKMPTGARPSPRNVIAAATPYKPTIQLAPQFSVVPKKLSMWDNDRDGICVTANECFDKACYSPEIFIRDEVMIEWADRHGWRNGAVISDVLDAMTTEGMTQDDVTYKDGPKLSVDWTNTAILLPAIAVGPVKIGVAADQLQGVVTGVNGWFATGFRNDGNTDHCVSLSGYGPLGYLFAALGVPVPRGVDPTAPGYHLFTWGTIGVIDVHSMRAITSEAWLSSPTTIIDGPGPGPGPSDTGTLVISQTLSRGGYSLTDPAGSAVGVLQLASDVQPGTYTFALNPTPNGSAGTLTVSNAAMPGRYDIPSVGSLQLAGSLSPGVGYLIAGGAGQAIALPVWLLALLRAACALSPALAPPWSTVAQLACGLLPGQEAARHKK